MPTLQPFAFLFLFMPLAFAADYHVAPRGNDNNPGTRQRPLRTIQEGANRAQPGDNVIVHAGTYRERVNPPRGGLSNEQRIVYRSARGARVDIKGSEVVKGWSQAQPGVWKVTVANSFFGSFNPYTNIIRGDWFNPLGRPHHTGAVYLNGEWLTEAVSLEEVLMPGGAKPDWLFRVDHDYLLNVAMFRPEHSERVAPIPAAEFARQQGVNIAPCSEGGECIGMIEHGDWVTYDNVNFGAGTRALEFRVASAASGGIIEMRLDGPDGELLGACAVLPTGDWQSWTSISAGIKPTAGVRALCLVFRKRLAETLESRALSPRLWFAQVDDTQTTLWAQFDQMNPNEELVEIHVRQSVFYPDQPGRNFITVRGFHLAHAATPWAPPTAEQIGLIGTHWSKGWIIEDNRISHSTCTGVTLGKHGDAFDNTSADTAEGYVKTIERAHAHAIPWTREHIGHHLVRRNTISFCEQAGIVGSLGAAFSTIEDNVIHTIHVRRLFTGAEMAGIKIHAAIDSMIRRNHVYRTHRGLWLDWMAQGTRVSRNLFHNNISEDLFVEVNHGPFLVDNNLFLSSTSLLDMSQGGSYAHNLFAGKITNRPEPDRETPYHPPHSTHVAGLAVTTGGDDRFYNNLFIGDAIAPSSEQRANLEEVRWISSFGLWGYDGRKLPLLTGGNVYYSRARPYAAEPEPLLLSDCDPMFQFAPLNGRFTLRLNTQPLRNAHTQRVTTDLLGLSAISKLPMVNPDGSSLVVDYDYFGRRRRGAHPTPGPFERTGNGERTRKVW